MWLEGLPQTDMKPRTISDYRNETRRYIKPHLGDVKLTKLTPLHLERLYRTLMAEGGRGGRPLSPKTVLRVHRVIRKAIGDAERKGILQRNVARLADKPSTAQLDTERPAWTPDELRAFLGAAEGEELFALYRLAALTGMRRSELCGLRWEDVSLADQTVRVRQTLGVTNGVPVVSTPKSRRSRRVIDIDDRTTDILRAHWDQQRQAAEFVGEGWTETGYVFTTVIGTPQHPDNVSKRFVALVRTIDVRYLTLHGLRHTHAAGSRWARTREWSANASATPTWPSPSRSTATSSPATNARPPMRQRRWLMSPMKRHRAPVALQRCSLAIGPIDGSERIPEELRKPGGRSGPRLSPRQRPGSAPPGSLRSCRCRAPIAPATTSSRR